MKAFIKKASKQKEIISESAKHNTDILQNNNEIESKFTNSSTDKITVDQNEKKRQHDKISSQNNLDQLKSQQTLKNEKELFLDQLSSQDQLMLPVQTKEEKSEKLISPNPKRKQEHPQKNISIKQKKLTLNAESDNALKEVSYETQKQIKNGEQNSSQKKEKKNNQIVQEQIKVNKIEDNSIQVQQKIMPQQTQAKSFKNRKNQIIQQQDLNKAESRISEHFNPLEEIDQARFKIVAEQKEKITEEKINKLNKIFSKKDLEENNLPEDWSIKSQIDLQINVDKNFEVNDEIKHLLISIENKIKQQSFYTFSTLNIPTIQFFQSSRKLDQCKFQFSRDLICNLEIQLKMQIQLQWFKSFRDVYQKFLDNKSPQNYFYIRNQSFLALFKYQNIEAKNNEIIQYEQVCQIIPSPALSQLIMDDENLKFKTEKYNIEQKEEEETGFKQTKIKEKEDAEEEIDFDQLFAELDQPINLQQNNQLQMDSVYFKIQKRDHYKIHTFKGKNLQSIYNLLANFVSQKLLDQFTKQNNQGQFMAQIVSRTPFVNCTYNEPSIIFSSSSFFKNKFEQEDIQKQDKILSIKSNGLFTRSDILGLLQYIQQQLQKYYNDSQINKKKSSDKKRKDSAQKEKKINKLQLQIKFETLDENCEFISNKNIYKMVTFGSKNDVQENPFDKFVIQMSRI